MSHLAVGFPDGPVALGLVTPALGRLRPVLIGDGPGVTALARSPSRLYVATRPFAHLGESDAIVLVYQRDDLMFDGRYRLEGIGEVRGMFHWDGSLYLGAPSTAQVIALRADGRGLSSDRFVWNPPDWLPGFEPASLALHGCDVLATSGPDLINLTRATRVLAGLRPPTTLLSLGADLCLAEELQGAVWKQGGASRYLAGRPVAGLALLEGLIHTLSRGDSGLLELLRLDPVSLELRETVPLGGRWASPSCLITVEEAGGWPDAPGTRWLASHGRPL